MKSFISLTDRRIATKQGHVLVFKAGEPQEVPPSTEQDLLIAGLSPATPETIKASAAIVTAHTEQVPFDRAVFEAAAAEVIAKNNPKDMTDAGNPKLKAIEAITGFPVKAVHVMNFMKSLSED